VAFCPCAALWPGGLEKGAFVAQVRGTAARARVARGCFRHPVGHPGSGRSPLQVSRHLGVEVAQWSGRLFPCWWRGNV